MQADIRLVLLYLDQPPFLVREGWPATALGALAELEFLTFDGDDESHDITLRARLLTAEQAEAAGLTWTPPTGLLWESMGEHLLCLEGVIDYDLDALVQEMREQGFDATDEAYAREAEDLIGSSLRKVSGDFDLASEVADPGALCPQEVQCYVNGRPMWSENRGGCPFGVARAEFAKSGWPAFGHLRIADTLAWMRGVPGFGEGVPRGPLGRALAAASHLGHSGESGLDLVWAMRGLEALYVGGREGLSEQMRDKTRIVLGTPGADRRRFDSLYNYRSRFVHGDIDMPVQYCPYDGLDSFLDPTLEYYHAALTAVALLSATLQEMARTQRRSLDFHWELERQPAVEQAPQPDAP